MKNKYLILILAYFVIVCSIGISSRDVGTGWDEAWYIITIKKMIEKDSWLIPHTFDEKQEPIPNFYEPPERFILNKPPGFFWLGIIFAKTFGMHIFSIRLLSLISGFFSIIIFYLINIRFYNKKQATINTAVFSSLPIFIMYARTGYMETAILFYTLSTTLVFIAALEKPRNVYLSIPLIALNLLTKLWTGFLPTLGVAAWYLTRRKKEYKKVIFSLTIAFLIFLSWPLYMSINEDQYDRFYRMEEGDSVWKMIFGFHTLNKVIPEKDSSISNTIITNFFSPYEMFDGNFETKDAFPFLTLLLLISGILLLIIKHKVFLKSHSIWLFWLLFVMPINTAIVKPVHYLVILSPVIAAFMGLSFYHITNKILKKNIFIVLILLLLFIEPISLIISQEEPSYKTGYREIGAFIDSNTEENKIGIVAQYVLGSIYYSKRGVIMANPNKDLEQYFKNENVSYAEITYIKKNGEFYSKNKFFYSDEQIRWIIRNCEDITIETGLKEDNNHRLMDCKQ